MSYRCLRYSTALAVVMLCLTIPEKAQAEGIVVISSDEWLTSDPGWREPESARFLSNLMTLFGGPGDVLAYSGYYGLTGNTVATAMTAAGNTWTVDAALPFTLSNLLAYDAIFLAGPINDSPITYPDMSVLTQYVQAGGDVLVLGGTGYLGAAGEAAAWSPFLGTFGLGFGDTYAIKDGPACGVDDIISDHSLFSGVAALYVCGGQETIVTDSMNPNAQVIARDPNGFALFAISTDNAVPAAIPEPAGVFLLCSGLGALMLIRRKPMATSKATTRLFGKKLED